MTKPPVAPVVTDEMVQAALKIACNQRPVGCGDGDTYTVSVPTFFSMRAAITAALEASGELERLRAANYAAFTDGMEAAAQICGTLAEVQYDDADGFEAATGCEAAIMQVVKEQRSEQAKARTALQGDAP